MLDIQPRTEIQKLKTEPKGHQNELNGVTLPPTNSGSNSLKIKQTQDLTGDGLEPAGFEDAP